MAHVTVENVNTRKVYTVGASLQSSFTIPFTFYEDEDIKVYNGSSLVSSNDYTVTGNAGTDGGYEGGTVTLDTAVSNTTITVILDIPVERTTDFPQSADFNIPALNLQLDKLTSILQKISEQQRRSLKLPVNSTISSGGELISLEMSEDPADGKAMVYDETTKKFRNTTASLENLEAYGEALADSADDMAIIAANLEGGDTIGQVAAIADAVSTNADNIDDIIAVANGIGQLNNGTVTYNFTAASGVDFAENEVGVVRSGGVIKSNASSVSTTEGFLVMATAPITGGSTGVWLVRGLRTGITGLQALKTYYLSTTAGSYSPTPPYIPGNAVRSIGTTNDAGELYFDPSSVPPLVIQETNSNQPVIVESSSSAYSGSATFTVPYPDGLAADDHVILIASYDSDGTANTFTPPVDFDELVAFTVSDGSNEGVGMQAWIMRADGTEGATFTFEQSLTRAVAVVCLRVSGLDDANPIDVSSITAAAASEPSLTSVTTTVDRTVNLAVVCWDAGKTLVTPPTGYTALQHVDLNGSGAGHPNFHDLWVGSKAQAAAGATGALAFDLSSSDDYVGFNIALRQFGATAGSASDYVAPFNVANDGFGYAMKLTLPTNANGDLSGSATEVQASTSPDYVAGRPQLENFTHPIYFQRTANAFRMSSPRVGATTSSNASSARCEFRHERNYLPTETIWFKTTLKYIAAPDDSDCVCVQIHRSDASPVIKVQWKVNADGTAIAVRCNVKKVGGGQDEATDKDGKSKIITSSIEFAQQCTVEVQWNCPTGDLKVWLNTANTNDPSLWFSGVLPKNELGQDVTSYIKPGGPYPGTSDTISPTSLFTFDILDFEIVEAAVSAAPQNLSVPTITGTATVGQTLTAGVGSWSGSTPITYTYQWKRNGTNISGATNSTYVLVTADGGQTVTVTVTASNGVSPNASATSASKSVAALSAPVNTVAPVVSGLAQENAVLSCSTGTWTGSAPIAYTYQWFRSPSTSISGATAANYLVTSGDIGSTLYCRVTATNTVSGVNANSAATGTVIAEPPHTLLSSVTSSVVFEIDATVSDSYSGSGSALLNLEPTPNDGSAQGDYDFTFSGLTFNGTAGSAAAYLSSAGSGYITVDAMTTFLKTLHKTSGTSFWFLMAGQFANAATNQTFFSTLGTAEDNAANNGLLVRTNTSEQPRIYQLTAGTPTKKSASPVQSLLLASPTFFAMSFNLLNGVISTWTADGAGGITEVNTTITLQTNTADPDGVFRLLACTAATQLMVNGTRFYTAAMGNTTLTPTELQNMLTILGTRHSRDYTP